MDGSLNELEEAREHALKRLSLREHSVQELTAFLEKKGHSGALVAEVVAQLVSEDIVNDRRYARAIARNQVGRTMGPGSIQHKLLQKGVCVEMSDARTLFDETANLSESEMARKLIERRYPRAFEDEKVMRRAYAALLRRGFSSGVACEALKLRRPAAL